MASRSTLHQVLAALRSVPLLVPVGVVLVIGVIWLVPTTLVAGDRIFSPSDFGVFHHAGRVFLSGGDPYGPEFARWDTGDPTRAPYAYPAASFWVLLPLLPLPVGYGAILWLVASVASLLLLAPLVRSRLPSWMWLTPLLYYPSLYAVTNTQWPPIQLGLLAISLWLYLRGSPLWAGFILPLALVKPTVGLGLGSLALVMCGADRRWWMGVLAGGLFWYGLPLLIQPDWPLRWLASVRHYGSPSDAQFLLTVTDLPDGKVCFALTVAIALTAVWRREWRRLGCALLILAMLATPHRAQYDYAVLFFPFLFLPSHQRWLAGAAVAISWSFPLTFALGWTSSFQLTLFTFVPALMACLWIHEAASEAQASGMETVSGRQAHATVPGSQQ